MIFTWQDRAACTGMSGSLFFGPDGERQAVRDLRETTAKRVCRRCPVRVDCLDYALNTGQDHGIWGGLTEDGRAAERQRRKGVAS